MLALSGSMMSGPEVAPLLDEVKTLVAEGVANVVVDLSEVQWFGSSMLGVLSASLMSVQKAEGQFRLSGMTPKVQSIMRVTRLAAVFQTAESIDGALASESILTFTFVGHRRNAFGRRTTGCFPSCECVRSVPSREPSGPLALGLLHARAHGVHDAEADAKLTAARPSWAGLAPRRDGAYGGRHGAPRLGGRLRRRSLRQSNPRPDDDPHAHGLSSSCSASCSRQPGTG